ncbi:MAG: gliding motility-associated C-terminal domain-containing protein, partial [Saprospiraceae bacterium]|nr:gliding motility-associated C-terminal domain-containing protein [Saprospiraceae bacterium]
RFTITFVVTAVSGSTSFYNVTLGNQSFGPFNYGQTATISGLTASGQNLTLTATDANNNGCTVQFTAKQDPCSTCPQVISAGNDIQLTCAQNVATLSATSSGTGGIFVWTGPNNFNKTGQTVTTSLEGEYTLTVTFPDQCVKTDKVMVLKDANLPVANAGPDQELTCKKLTATLTGSSNLTSNVIFTWTNAAGTVIGNTPSINVTAVGFYYLEVTNTQNNCKSGKDEVEVYNRNQQLTFNTKTWTCSNGGTPSNSGDDIYTIVFNLANSLGATNQYRILYQGVEVGVYNYNTTVQLTAPADGQERTYEFEDLVTGCKTSTKVGPLTSCSTTCLISFDQYTSDCNDNGTESDETDDTYTITFVVNALNGGAVKSFIVFVDGVDKGTYTYGSKVTLTLPANRATPFIQLQDKNIAACLAVVPAEALIPCSSTCTLNATVSNILCNDNGTINDPADDKFFFDVIAEGLNTSATWKINGDTRSFNYNERINLGPYPISGGNITLTLTDSGDSDCSFVIQVKAPSVCSEPCVLQAAEIQILDCNNNNTGNTTADDYFGVRFRVNRISGSATNYTVSDGTNTFGPFIYGQLVTIDQLPANGNIIVLSVTDPSNTGCKTSFTVQKAPCSSCTQSVDAGSDKLITCQDNIATLTATSSQNGVFTWTGPSGFNSTGPTVQTSTPGMYYISVLYADQCVAKDSVRVNKDANVPTASGGPDKLLNCLITSVSLVGTNSPGGNLSLIWTNANGVQVGSGNTINVTTPGVYYFEVINTTNNCSSGKDEVKVTQNTTKPDAEIVADPGNLLDCIVGTVVLSGKPIANVIFNWQTGESFINNQPSITISKEGIVTMTAIDTINGCQDIASIEIIDLQDYPILVTSPAPPITCVNNGTFLSAGNSPSGPNLVFTWLDASNKVISTVNNDSIYVAKPGTYYVILTDTLNGCSNRDTFQVNSIGDFPAVKVPEDITLYCGKTNTPITASIQNPSGAFTVRWTATTGTIQGSNTQAAINATGEGIYVIEVTYQNSGCKTTDDVKVIVDKDYPTQLTASLNNETCKEQKDGAFIVTAVNKGKPPFVYTLNGKPAGAGPAFGNLSPGNYNLVVTDQNGCSFDTTFVVAPGVDISLLATSPVEILYNQQKVIEVLTNLKPSEIASIQWRPSENLSCDTCLVTLVDAKKDVTYTVVITDINGCTESINISIRVKENSIITAPNIINISGSSNKYFTIFGNESVLNILKMRIYDRWGNLVFVKSNFKPNNPTEGWDGTFNGEDVVPGVFVYVVEYETISGAKILSGDVTVIK